MTVSPTPTPTPTRATDRLGESLDIRMEAIRERSAALPWYRRPRRLRRQVAGTLVVTALVAVALFGGLSYYASDQLLRQGAADQLTSVAKTRAVRIENGANRTLSEVATVAADLGVVEAFSDLQVAFDDLDVTVSPAQQAELDAHYETRVVEPINATGLFEVTVDELQPDSDAARWIQYHHTLPDTDPASDTSSYGDALAVHDPFLTELADTIDVTDMLFISTSGDVIYTVDKRIDLGTSIVEGPFADSVVARLARDEVGRVRTGRGVLSDYELYLPNRAQPSLFAAAEVRDGTRIIGTIALELPGAALDSITTAGFDWDRMGLDGGESYVVSSDLVLQSITREWLDDPEAYLDAIDDPDEARAIETFGTPVGLQTVDTEPVREAFLGEAFSGSSRNHVGRSTYSSSVLIDVAGVDWVVVTDIPIDRAREPVDDFLRSMLVVAAIVIPLAALVGVLIARRLSRPIGPAVDAARAVAEGERQLELPSLGNDEFGDLGRRLTRMAAALERQEQALSDEYEHKRQMMLSVLPAHLVGDDGVVVGNGDATDIATVVSMAIDTDELGLDPDELSELVGAVSALENRLVEQHGLQRIRVAADRGLFLAGVGSDDTGAATGIDFVRELLTGLDTIADETAHRPPMHVGVSTGPIATGVLATGSLTFGAWGEPVRRALAISALSTGSEALLDASTLAEIEPTTEVVEVADLIDLDGQPMAVYSLVLPAAAGDRSSDS